MTTPEDSAAVTPETARVVDGLERLRAGQLAMGWSTSAIDAAIDRLIVLDGGDKPKPVYCCSACGLDAMARSSVDLARAMENRIRDGLVELGWTPPRDAGGAVTAPQDYARDAEILRIADAMQSVAGPGAPYASASVPRYAVLGWVEQIRAILAAKVKP